MHLNSILNLVFVFKTLIIIILFLPIVGLISCRKKIDHQLGSTTTVENYDPSSGGVGGGSTNGCTLISSSEILLVDALQVFNNELYVGGEFENNAGTVKHFGKLNAQNQLIPAVSGSVGRFGVYDLEVVNNELIIGGSISYIEGVNVSYNSIRMDASGSVSDIDFCAQIFEYINDINVFNGGILFSGNFDPANPNSVTTSNVDLLQSFSSVGMSSTSGTIRSSAVHQGILYIAGEDDGLLEWTGSFWSDVSYTGEHWTDEIFSVVSYNSELYVAGKFYGGAILKKQNSSGVWEDIAGVSQIGSMGARSKLKVVNNQLYFCSNALMLDGTTASSLLLLNGVDWESIGLLTAEVRDIEYFNGKLYIATNNGLYEY